MGDRDRELSPRARDIVARKLTLGAEDGDFLPSTVRYQDRHQDRNEREGLAPCKGR
jgi:hypothetical protein